MSHIDKVIISSDSALAKKYGAAGKSGIDAAVSRLIAADAARGLTTQYISIAGTTERDYKDAVDAIYNAHTPHYIAILGAPDVIPHQSLTNPLYSPKDLDADIPSDLPYACAAPYSVNPADFIAPDRVVSRIPDVLGATNSAYLETVLDHAALASAPPAGSYSSFLGISAEPWQASTQLSLTTAFGSAAGLQVSPSDGAVWTTSQWGALAHFINCHGATEDWRFYGQNGSTYPYAHVAHYVDTGAKPGTIVAAECCYGAELYDPSTMGVHQGIANTYMERGAFGFVGSTNIAYGPSNTNGYADHICADFFKHVRAGQSLGAAMLLARQDYVTRNAPLDPVSVKTLAQFVLYGDPSIYAVLSSPPSGARRAERRRQATVNANELENSTAVSEGQGTEAPPDVEQKVRAAVRNGERTSVLTFACRRKKGGGTNALTTGVADSAAEPSSFQVAWTSQHPEGDDPEERWGVTRTMVQIFTDVGGTVIDTKEAFSK
jgi:hypothetical protein